MIKTIVAAVIAIASLAVASPAQAEDPHADHQPCVSNREYHSVYQMIKPELEKRWEVEGLGIQAILPFGLVHQLVIYPRCGYTMDVAWYGITYKRRGKHLWAVWATQCETWNTGTSCLASAGLDEETPADPASERHGVRAYNATGGITYYQHLIVG